MKTIHKPYGPYEKFIKRPLDFLFASCFLLLFWWLYLLLAILVRIKLGAPVLFTQERPGRKNPKTGLEEIIHIYKFRSMANAKDKDGKLLEDSARLSTFGAALRKTSLDELPEMFNILKGDMSLIGPRPLLVRYLPRYTEEQRGRHDVRPGLTGNAQAHGRNAVSWEEKFDMDVAYVNHITFLGDLKILLDTVKTVLKRDGISSGTSVTMEEFMGTLGKNKSKD